MAAAISLRDDYDGAALRALAKASKDASQTRRLLCLALIYDGGRRGDAAALGGVGLQIIRDWVLRFNAEGPAGLIDRKAPGGKPKLNDEQRRALCEIVERGPIPAIHGVVRWRLIDLDESTVSRELKALGFVKITARPRHRAQNELAVEAFKKVSRPRWRRSGPGCRRAAR
jgi:transposase